MNESFALMEHCFLVSGAKRVAIYDLKTGDIFSINGDALKLLKLCESSFSIQEIVEKFNLLAVNLFYWAINFLNWLNLQKQGVLFCRSFH